MTSASLEMLARGPPERPSYSYLAQKADLFADRVAIEHWLVAHVLNRGREPAYFTNPLKTAMAMGL